MDKDLKLQNIIFIARSGGGKGTQAKKLIEYIATKDKRNVFHMQSGARIRDFLQESSHAAKLARELSPQGKLQPAFLSVWGWAGELIKKLDVDEHLILDGAPRRLDEAKLVTEALHFFKREDIKVIYIDVSNEWSRERLLGRHEGRKDDSNLNAINKRFHWFDEEVLPVLDYFRENEYFTVYEIDGEQTIERVHQDIVEALEI